MTRLVQITLGCAVALLGPCSAGAGAGRSHDALWSARGHAVAAELDLRYAGIERQDSEHSCGFAALATVARSYGLDVSETELTRLAGASGPASVSTLVFLASALGMEASAVESRPSELVRYFERFEEPVIALLARPRRHFTVVTYAGKGIVVRADPSMGHLATTVESFERVWSGVVVFVRPPARAAVPAEGPLRDATAGAVRRHGQLVSLASPPGSGEPAPSPVRPAPSTGWGWGISIVRDFDEEVVLAGFDEWRSESLELIVEVEREFAWRRPSGVMWRLVAALPASVRSAGESGWRLGQPFERRLVEGSLGPLSLELGAGRDEPSRGRSTELAAGWQVPLASGRLSGAEVSLSWSAAHVLDPALVRYGVRLSAPSGKAAPAEAQWLVEAAYVASDRIGFTASAGLHVPLPPEGARCRITAGTLIWLDPGRRVEFLVTAWLEKTGRFAWHIRLPVS